MNGSETHEPDVVADMYRSLSLYPTSADPARVAEIVEATAAGFKQSPGFRQ